MGNLGQILLILILVVCCLGDQMCEIDTTNRTPTVKNRVIDITHLLREDLPVWESDRGLGKIVDQIQSIANGSLANFSEMKMGVHTGTHVDSPSHFLQDKFLSGIDTTNALDLTVLNGPVLVVESPTETNITANVIKELVPRGVERIIFRTSNTHRRNMWKTAFVTDYTAVTSEGAEWIVKNTDIKLIGIDYLSIAIYTELADTHRPLLKKGVILLEGLDLDDADPGIYMLHCLPAKLVGSDGSPTRCILML